MPGSARGRTLRAAPVAASATRRGRVTQPAPGLAAPGTLPALEAHMRNRSSANHKAQSRLELFARQHRCCPAAGVRGRLSLPTVGGAAQAHLWHRCRSLPALRRTHAPFGRHHRPRQRRALPPSPRRADRAPHPRSSSSPAVLAEQDCTTPRPIRAVLAAGVVRGALNGDCTDSGDRRVAAPTRAAGRRSVHAPCRPRPIEVSALANPARRSLRSAGMRSGTRLTCRPPPNCFTYARSTFRRCRSRSP
jgi:hypothetical protein